MTRGEAKNEPSSHANTCAVDKEDRASDQLIATCLQKSRKNEMNWQEISMRFRPRACTFCARVLTTRFLCFLCGSQLSFTAWGAPVNQCRIKLDPVSCNRQRRRNIAFWGEEAGALGMWGCDLFATDVWSKRGWIANDAVGEIRPWDWSQGAERWSSRQFPEEEGESSALRYSLLAGKTEAMWRDGAVRWLLKSLQDRPQAVRLNPAARLMITLRMMMVMIKCWVRISPTSTIQTSALKLKIKTTNSLKGKYIENVVDKKRLILSLYWKRTH